MPDGKQRLLMLGAGESALNAFSINADGIAKRFWLSATASCGASRPILLGQLGR